MKKTYVFIGNFGSGKTELALNTAINAALSQSTVLVDLDIINPYFRAAERRELLAQKNIKLIYPMFAMTGVEAPSIPPDVYSVFVDEHETVVFDVGGDPSGAVALGQYKRNFDELKNLETLFVVNPMRPLSSNVADIVDLVEKISFKSRLKITGLVNNSNLSNENSAQIINSGYQTVKAVSDALEIPVRYTCGEAQILSEFFDLARERGYESKYLGEAFPIERFMHRDWERFTQKGI